MIWDIYVSNTKIWKFKATNSSNSGSDIGMKVPLVIGVKCSFLEDIGCGEQIIEFTPGTTLFEKKKRKMHRMRIKLSCAYKGFFSPSYEPTIHSSSDCSVVYSFFQTIRCPKMSKRNRTSFGHLLVVCVKFSVIPDGRNIFETVVC